jgi:hypothetical protein
MMVCLFIDLHINAASAAQVTKAIKPTAAST